MPWIAPQADLSITLENGLVKNMQQNIGVVRESVTLESPTLDNGNVDATAETTASNGAHGNGTVDNGNKSNGEIKSARDRNREEVTQEAMKTGQTARLQCECYHRPSIYYSSSESD
ncbi:hypothetical protein PC116_g31991 [Phytophthora cactorum]|nr:hypothetical protein PC116_g31991 [Phytophthora cactorum]